MDIDETIRMLDEIKADPYSFAPTSMGNAAISAANHLRRLRDATNGLLGVALIGALSDDEIKRDYGELGYSQVTRARAALSEGK